MKKFMKKIAIGCMSLVFGGICLQFNSKVEKLEYVSLKQAEAETIQQVYRVSGDKCFKTIDDIKAEYRAQNPDKELEAALAYVFNDKAVTTSNGQIYKCTNPNTLIYDFESKCTNGVNYYLDANYTTPIAKPNKVGDILEEIKAVEVDENGCIKSYKQVTVLYAKCKSENNSCNTDYDKTFNITYVVDGEVLTEQISKETFGSTSELLPISKSGYTFDGWYLDAEYKTKINGNNVKALNPTTKVVDECINGYNDITLYGRFISDSEPTQVAPNNNPETGDNIYIYIILGAIIIVAGAITVKKLTNK